MISSLHYYGYFDNSISKKNNRVTQLPYKNAIENNKSKSVKLDTAYKKDIISYAKDLSQSVNGTKTISYDLLNNISKYIPDKIEDYKDKENKNTSEKESLFKLNLDDNFTSALKKFASVLNKTTDFKEASSQSQNFNHFSESIEQLVKSSPSLNALGLFFEDERYDVNEDAINNLDDDYVLNLLEDSYKDISDVYNKTSEFLSAPLTDHMAFKNFSYYYSYSTGVMKNNSFNLFSVGTLLNLKL